MSFLRKKVELPSREDALAGRGETMPVPDRHYVNGNPLIPPFPDGFEQIVVGMGCFWGAERIFWEAPGVFTTAVGYAGGSTPNPTYQEVCSGRTGHTEVVLAVFDPGATSYEEMLRLFWENHDPTQGMRQGNDVGTQYRSAIYVADEAQREAALASRDAYNAKLEMQVTASVPRDLDQALASRLLAEAGPPADSSIEALAAWGPPEDSVRTLLPLAGALRTFRRGNDAGAAGGGLRP